ncbi:Oidioi.mRNA.OKI2018_I69.PAR.g8923.t1.cds [Oikopleura dioica]|uniref:Oidioi.mRNA.OKI2018_I69.PAR.g8923.t1.cds n=1 Tax=Oikopleura dioica TaxID=34765 RepID=A0ABN7RMR4_OIKDI|nr:Oidioi.mRNA.OKI2018_I69.PAR.g8923.t1.cds [Oikopleura dioica]
MRDWQAKCVVCSSRGKAVVVDNEVWIIPNSEQEARKQLQKWNTFRVKHYKTKGRFQYVRNPINNHGFGTLPQLITVVSLGSLFWIAVALLTSYLVFEGKKFTAGFGSACVMEYKKCILDHPLRECVQPLRNCGNPFHEDFKTFVMPISAEDGITIPPPGYEEQISFTPEESEANEKECLEVVKFGAEMCKQLCLKHDHAKYFLKNMSECSEICLHIGVPTEQICPLHEKCPDGCPCPEYICTKTNQTKAVVFVKAKYDFYTDKYTSLRRGSIKF